MSFIQLGRVRIAARRQSGDASFFENGAPPPVLPALTAQEEAESLAMWRRARKRRAKEAGTSRGLTSMGLYAAALVALSHLDRAIESWATPQADGDGGAPPDRPGEVAAASGEAMPVPLGVGLAWTISPEGVVDAPVGTGASIIWPVRAAPGSSTPYTEIMARAEGASVTTVAAAAQPTMAELGFAAQAADAARLTTPMTATEAAIALPAEARLPGAARAQQPAEAARPAPRDAATNLQAVTAEAQPASKGTEQVDTVVASLAAPASLTPEFSGAALTEPVEVKQAWTPQPLAEAELTHGIITVQDVVPVAEVAGPGRQLEGLRGAEMRPDAAPAKIETPVAKVETTPLLDIVGQPAKDGSGNGRPVQVEAAAPSPGPSTPAAVEASAGVGLPKPGGHLSDLLTPGNGRGEVAKPVEAATTPVVEAVTGRGNVAPAPGVGVEVRADAGVALPPGLAGDGPGRSGSAPGRVEAVTTPVVGEVAKPVGAVTTPVVEVVTGRGNVAPAPGVGVEVRADAGVTLPPGLAGDGPGRSGSAPGRVEAVTAPVVGDVAPTTPAVVVAADPATPVTPTQPVATPTTAEVQPGGRGQEVQETIPAVAVVTPDTAPKGPPAHAAATPPAEAAVSTPPAGEAVPIMVAEGAAPTLDTPHGNAETMPPTPTQPASPVAEAGSGSTAGAEATPVQAVAQHGNGPKSPPSAATEAAALPAVAQAGGNGKADDAHGKAGEGQQDVQAALDVILGWGKGGNPNHPNKGPGAEPGPAADFVAVDAAEAVLPPITSDLVL